jgi:hypothetical protein
MARLRSSSWRQELWMRLMQSCPQKAVRVIMERLVCEIN